MSDYSEAWASFRKTDDFKRCMEHLVVSDPKVYRTLLENRVRYGFDAGWNAALMLHAAERSADNGNESL